MNDMRLIDADVINYDDWKWSPRYGWVSKSVIDTLPTIDAVPVVRCKNCIHWLNEDGLNDHVCLKIYSDGAVSAYAWQDREPDDFCSYGERKGGDTDG